MADAIKRTKRPKQQYICGKCSSEFFDWPSQRKGRPFCSVECHYAASAGVKRSPRPNSRKRITKPCGMCGAPMNGVPCHIRRKKFCSLDCTRKSQTGALSIKWKGGTNRWRMGFSQRAKYNEWRLSVLVRDGGLCRWCDSLGVRKSGRLEVHHIVPLSVSRDLVFDPDNGISLCKPHHLATAGRENEFAEMLSSLIGAQLKTSPSPNRKDKFPLAISEAKLRELYLADRLSTVKIGAMFGVTPECVQKYLRRFKIKARSPSEAASMRGVAI